MLENSGAWSGFRVEPLPNIVNVAAGGKSGAVAWAVDTTGDIFAFSGPNNYAIPYATRDAGGGDGGGCGKVTQIAVSPTGSPWFVNSAGQLWSATPDDGGPLSCIAQNNCGVGNNPETDSFMAVAAGPTGPYHVWAIATSEVEGSCDHDVFYGEGNCMWTQAAGVSAVEVAVSPPTGTPWLRTCAGHVLVGTLGDAGTWTFNRVDPFPWDLDGGSFDAGRYTNGMLASSIALGAAHFDAGPSAPSGVGAWAVTDSGIAELVLWNGPNNATWNQVPSSLPLVHVGTHSASPLNAVQISASWEAGSPWVVTEEGYVYSAPGWPRQ